MIHLSRKGRFIAVMMLVAYVASYFLWSRISARVYSEPWGVEGFYFVFPTSARAKLINHWITFFYFPMVYIESVLGTGPGIAYDPTEILTWKSHDGEPRSGHLTMVTLNAPLKDDDTRVCHPIDLASAIDDYANPRSFRSGRHHAFPRNRFTLIE